MNVLRFQARNSAEAIRQIRSQLGAEAVVLSVSPLPVTGFGRLWRRPGLEVLAGLPDQPETVVRDQQPEVRHNREESRGPTAKRGDQGAGEVEHTSPTGSGTSEANRTYPAPRLPQIDPDLTPVAELQSCAAPDDSRFIFSSSPPAPHAGAWRTVGLLQQMGVQPLCIDKVFDRVRASCGDEPPASFAREFACVRAVLGSFWQPPPPPTKGSPPIHVFVGPPGSGKTTVLCKWLAKSVLAERQTPRTWRLDSRTANFAGLLDFYSEILNVPLEREWRGVPTLPGFDLGFVDLPGTNPQDAVSLQQLRTQIQAIPAAQVHLVLNSAYDISVLLAQTRAFACLRISDLILTHLDEEKRRGKLWNLVLGTNCPVRFLSGGQNIPGDFSPAAPELLFSR